MRACTHLSLAFEPQQEACLLRVDTGGEGREEARYRWGGREEVDTGGEGRVGGRYRRWLQVGLRGSGLTLNLKTGRGGGEKKFQKLASFLFEVFCSQLRLGEGEGSIPEGCAHLSLAFEPEQEACLMLRRHLLGLGSRSLRRRCRRVRRFRLRFEAEYL